MTELDVNGTLLLDTENSVVVNMTSASQVDINNVVVWTRAADLPVPITDFVATNDLQNFITCTWTEEAETLTTDLYVEGLGIVATDVTSPHDWVPPERVVEYNMGIVSNGDEGSILSNQEIGMLAQLSGSVVIDYNSYSFEGSGDGTVSISSGSGVFTPPAGITELTVCMVGGGGSGATVPVSYGVYGGGGWAGTVVSSTYSVTPEIGVSIIIGSGGNNPSSQQSGNAGSSSALGTLSAGGGAGGIYMWNESPGFNGAGASVTTCGGTGNDGTNTNNGTVYYGGQSSGFGNGGNYGQSGGIGSGAGCTYGDPNISGGDGRIIVSW